MEIFAFLVAVFAVFVFIYRKKSTSDKIVTKVIISVFAIGFTFASFCVMISEIDDLTSTQESVKFDTRLANVERLYEKHDYSRMADDMKYQNDYEPEFDQYWEVLLQNHNDNLERVYADAGVVKK